MSFIYMSEPLQKAHPWQTYEGEGIVLFYLPCEANDERGVQSKANLFDWALQENYRVLQVDALWFKVHVFMFPDAVSHAAALDYDEPQDGGAAQLHSITLVDHLSSEEIRCLAVHELAHVVTMNVFGCDIPGFLMEGIAVYAQNAVPETAFVNLTHGWEAPGITMQEPLEALMETPEFDYSHAGAFIGYLARQDAGELYRLKAFCRIIEALHWQPYCLRVERATLAVYKLSLSDMEAAWRNEPVPQS